MKHFNVRVYGILIQNNNVLVSDELIHNKQITKFPGGGLEFGEGTLECLKREFIEEMDLKINVQSHFYTTDFFVSSAFNDNSQVISIYYLVDALEPIKVKISDQPYDFSANMENPQSFRWLDVNTINDSHFTFAIDKKVSELLKTKNI